MAHSIIFPRRSFFYAIGNTSAEVLTDSLPPEEHLDLLSLGCGDPRNILYTVYSDATADSRAYDITCCDVEPAILARNVLLFTLLADTDQGSDTTIWEIFYHLRISGPSLALLQRHCFKLLAVSENLDQWSGSSYAKFIKPRTEHTLRDMRRFWFKYVTTTFFIPALKQHMRETLEKGIQEVTDGCDNMADVQTASLSAGLFWEQMFKSGLAGKHYAHYWKHGVVGGSPTATATEVNPTFMYTEFGTGFTLHYGSDPILGFHLAGLFAPIEGRPARPDIAEIGAYVQREFGDWCAAFRTRLASAVKFVIRPYVGDALSFCRALVGEAGQTISLFDGRPIVLDNIGDDALPRTFNVIETSNIADHIGLFNVLTVSVPLLRQSPWSVLHTNTLLPRTDKTTNGFLERVGIDLTPLSLLLGLAPQPLLSRFSSKPPSKLTGPPSDVAGSRFRQPIAWKYPMSGDQAVLQDGSPIWNSVALDPERFSDILFSLYLHMFANESLEKMRERRSIEGSDDSSIVLDVRASFTAFLKLLKRRIQTDWLRAMKLLFDRIYADRSLMLGSNHFQDLFTQAHISGLYSFGYLAPIFDMPPSSSNALFANWRDTPLVVYLVMRVPRSAFQPLMDLPVSTVSTPMLQCELVARFQFHSIFSSMQLTFGDVALEGQGENAMAVISRDEEGWQGEAPVVVSLAVPSRLLQLDPQNTMFRLALRGTPHAASNLTSTLGIELVLHSASLMDEGVYIVKNPAHVHGFGGVQNVEGPVSNASHNDAPITGASPVAASGSPHTRKDAATMLFNEGTTTPSHLSVRVDFLSDSAREALAPKTAAVAARQNSPCTVQLLIGDGQFSDIVAYPFPVDARDAKVRVARKSGYTEVGEGVHPAVTSGGYTSNRMPVVVAGGKPFAWNLHYVNLATCPAMTSSQPISLIYKWLQPPLMYTFSDRELAMRQVADHSNTFVQVKGHIVEMMLNVCTSNDRVFGLGFNRPDGTHTIVFVNDVRFDLASQGMLLDVCVLPMPSHEMGVKVKDFLLDISLSGNICSIATDDEERVSWKKMLPAFVERCRTWAHRPDCQYLERGAPLATGHFDNPICACGKGKDIPTNDVLRRCPPLARLVTRAAIGLAFPVPYLEDIGAKGSASTKTMEQLVNEDRCWACMKGGVQLMACSRCKKIKYCSRACQAKDWNAHKEICAVIGAGMYFGL
uniref:MYND-type domain-containing protein n=1 Tax=Schizophyllum commune (strain H4-8 / FGSC 9210) TaxID=578458 RepID=D8PPJ1_SCHCM